MRQFHKLAGLAREPLLQFMTLGAGIWLVAAWVSPDRQQYEINIDDPMVRQIAGVYERQFGAPPQPVQLRGLVDRYINDEIAFREGILMGLDRDDEIVRRRVIQKFEFLRKDRTSPVQPTPDELERWYKTNLPRYRSSGQITFAHRFFSPDRGGSASAYARADQALRETAGKAAEPVGKEDAFPGPDRAYGVAPTEVLRIFGQSEIVEKLPDLPLGRWAGPFRSGYGWHIVRVAERSPPAQIPLKQIHHRVLADYLEEVRQRENQWNFSRIQKRYVIIREYEPI